MRLYYSHIRDLSDEASLYPGRSAARGSALGMSLLAAAYDDYAGQGLLSKLFHAALGSYDGDKAPSLCYSMSHSRTHVFCALSDSPVGVDTEPLDRVVSQGVIERLTTAQERENLSFLEIWTLRESFYKLTNQGDLRTLRFYRRYGKLVSPREDVFCRLYPNIGGAVAALCSFKDDFPEKPIFIPPEKLIKREKPLQSFEKDFTRPKKRPADR